MGMRWCAILMLASAALFCRAVPAAEPQDAELAEGAAIAAACRLGRDADDRTAQQLLGFALAMDPNNERALLLQAKHERGQPFDTVELADGGQQFVTFLEEAAATARPQARALLLYRVIELIDPTHERALLELTRAKNQGTNTDFDALLGALPAREPRTGDATPPEPAEKPAEKPRDLLAVLAETDYRCSIPTTTMIYTHPLNLLNELNRHLRTSGMTITVKSKTRRIQTYNEGREMQSDEFSSQAYRLAPYASTDLDPLHDATAQQAVWLLCALHELGWQQEGSRLVLVDAADAEGPGHGTLIEARTLATQMKKGQVDFLKAYKGKELRVMGLVSGLGRNSPRYIHLAGDQVRLYLGTRARDSLVKELAEDYERVVKAERTRRDDDDTGNYRFAPPRALLFVGAGRCDGITSGRIVFKGCNDFVFLRTNPARPE